MVARILITLTCITFFTTFATPPHKACANEAITTQTVKTKNRTFSLHRNDWAINGGSEQHAFTASPEVKKTTLDTSFGLSEEETLHENRKDKYKSKLMDQDDFEEKILDKIPYGHGFRKVWNVVDGDVDLYVTGLRADRRNKGVKYKTDKIPLIGTVDGLDLQFDAGERTEFSFESSHIPFAGKLEGFSFKGATGNKGSRISARYTIAFD